MKLNGSSDQALVVHFENVLQQLIDNAKELNVAAVQRVPADEMSQLQVVQNQLLQQLTEADEQLTKIYPEGFSTADPEAWNRVEKKLNDFAKLNKAFIKQLSKRRELIQFDSNTPN